MKPKSRVPIRWIMTTALLVFPFIAPACGPDSSSAGASQASATDPLSAIGSFTLDTLRRALAAFLL